MAADAKAPSLLDPIRELGVVEGGLTLATNMLPGVAAGAQAAGRATDGFTVNDLFGSLGDLAHEAAFYAPGIGETLGVMTGADILSSDTDLLTKALGATGIAGGVSTAAVLGVPHLALGAPRRGFSGVQGMPVPVRYSNPDLLARLSGTVSEPIQYDSILPTITGVRRDLMRASAGIQSRGWDRHAKLRQMRVALTSEKAGNANQVEGFLADLGDSLVAHVEDYRLSHSSQGMDRDKAAVAAAGVEASKFDWASEPINSRGDAVITVGDDLPNVVNHWRRLRAGEKLSDAERGELLDAMIHFARSTQGASHPEMAFQDPRMAITNIHLDGTDSKIGITHLEWDGSPLSELPADEVVKRISQMASINPAQLVPLIAANFERFYREQVLPNWDTYKKAVPRWSPDGDVSPAQWAMHWYKIARLDGEKMAKHHGLDPDRLVGVASLLSAGELWEQNLDKAVVALRYLNSKPGASTKQFKAHMKRKGFKTTSDEAENVFDMMQTLDVRMWFYTKLTGQTALKQPNFTKAILDSKPKDLRRHAALNYAMMRGEISDAHAANLFGELDLEVPVVIDRHALSLGLGFSMAPEGSASDRLYRSVRRGLEIAAASVGDVPELGRNMTPSEFQAITWVAWREWRGVTEDFVPLKGGLPNLWRQGSGPSAVWSRNILDKATQPLPMDILPRSAAPLMSRAKYRTPDQLSGRHEIPYTTTTGREGIAHSRTPRFDRHRTVTLELGETGVDLVADDPTGNRLLYVSSAFGPKGQHLRQRAPMLVDDVGSELGRLFDTTEDATGMIPGVTGGRRYTSKHFNPALEKGRHIVVSAPPQTRHNQATRTQHLETQQLLRDRGVNFTARIDAPHLGPTAVWKVGGRAAEPYSGESYWSKADLEAAGYDPEVVRQGLDREMRINLVLTFPTVHDLHLAWAVLNEPRPARMSRPDAAGSVASAAQGAANYVRMWGREFGLTTAPRAIRHGAHADETRGRKIATAYARSKWDRSDEKQVRNAYDQLVRETEAQYLYITEQLGIEHIVDIEEYASPREMMDDIANNRRLRTRPSTLDPHPYLTAEQNDQFRFVHDFFGHAGLGNSFNRNGEYIAYLKHAQMYSEQARGAMFTETMGANSWLVYSAKNQELRRRFLRRERIDTGEEEALKQVLMSRAGRVYLNPNDPDAQVILRALERATPNSSVLYKGANKYDYADQIRSGRVVFEHPTSASTDHRVSREFLDPEDRPLSGAEFMAEKRIDPYDPLDKPVMFEIPAGHTRTISMTPRLREVRDAEMAKPHMTSSGEKVPGWTVTPYDGKDPRTGYVHAAGTYGRQTQGGGRVEEIDWYLDATVGSEGQREHLFTGAFKVVDVTDRGDHLRVRLAAEAKPKFEAEFAPQKATILPRRFWSDHALSKEVGLLAPDGSNGGGRRLDDLYGEQVLDMAAYVYGDHEAPAGSVGVFEHQIEDMNGNRLVHMSADGDFDHKHTVRAHVAPDGLYSYFGDSTVHRETLAPGGHRFVVAGERVWWDGRAVVENPQILGNKVKTAEGRWNNFLGLDAAKHMFDVKADGKAPKQIALWMPPEGQRALPVMAYNRGSTSMGGRGRTVVLKHRGGNYLEGRGKITVEVKGNGAGEIDPLLRDDVHQFLMTSGWHGQVEFKAV